MIKKLLSLGLLLGLWGGLAAMLQNEIILPHPIIVFQKVGTLLGQSSFYISIGATFLRAHIAFAISLGLGLILAFLSFKCKTFEDIFLPWIKCLQSIPQISFIVLLLFWTSPQQSLIWVVFLMVFPIAYFNILEALKAIAQDYLDIIQISHQPWYYNLKKAYLPLSVSGLKATIKSGLPIALKVTVMAEVLIHSQIGIGRALSMARANIDMVSVFAWTFVLIILISLETQSLTYFFQDRRK